MDGAAVSAERALVFDLGGVLIDWDPRHLYRKLLPDAVAMEEFLARICTPAWNLTLDAGRPFAEGVRDLVAHFPREEKLIRAYHERWTEMVAGAIDDTVALLDELRAAHPVFALTNWSAETWPHAQERFDFLAWFRGIVVSGHEGIVKPDARIYRILLERHALVAEETIFIDDQPRNIEAARALGIAAIRFTGAADLRKELAARGVS
jgi:2-haloacid dehalogenase